MKKTQFIDLLTTIKKTSVSFTAIVVFIALGLAFYGGSTWSIKHTEDSYTKAYRDGHMRALLVTDALGLTEDQVLQLKEIDGIDDAEGLNIVYRFFEHNSGDRQQAAVVQITENIDLLTNVEGRLPDAAGQAAVLRSWATDNNVSIGDVIYLQSENAVDYRELQSVRSIAQWDGTDMNDLNISTEDPGYLSDTVLTVTAIVDSPVYLSTNPYAHGICSGNGLYVDAVFFVSKREMPPEIFGGYTSVAIYSEKLNEYNCFGNEYQLLSEALGDAVSSVIDGWDRQLVIDFGESVDAFRIQLDTLFAQTGELSAEGEILFSVLDQMRQKLNSHKSFASVMSTDSNNSFLTAENLMDVLRSLRSVLGITFLAIGIMICYSVVSRLVADSSVQIGTRKALGFSRFEIVRLYLCYVCSAMLLGGILGILIGVFGVEYAFTKVFSGLFTFTRLSLVCDPATVLPVFLVISGIIFLITVEACCIYTEKSTVGLLRGAPKEIKNFDFIQKSRLLGKLSLLKQTVLGNLFRDKRRVFGMITGIAGAAALITAGTTLYLNFTTAFSKQFQDYYRFDYQICYDSSSGSASENIRNILSRHGLDFAELYASCFILEAPDGSTNAPNVIVPADNAELAKLMYFDTESGDSVPYSGGLWMTEYYHYSFDAPIGSLLKLQTLDGTKAEIGVDRYYKHHLSTPVIVMDAATYRNAFGEEPSPNAFYVFSDGFDMDALDAELNEIDGYIYTYNIYDSFLASFLTEKTVIAAFAVLFILMAFLMSLMTIINLINVYISEKKNELIILMINGYDRKFAKRYIYYDTVFLTVIGVCIGLIAGSFLGNQTLTAIEGNLIRMIHGINYFSCAVSAVITTGLTFLICRRTLRKIDRFRLSDIDCGKQ